MKRPAQPEETVAGLCVPGGAVCSSYITGIVLPVMGGPRVIKSDLRRRHHTGAVGREGAVIADPGPNGCRQAAPLVNIVISVGPATVLTSCAAAD